MSRLFIALAVPDDVRESISEAVEDARRGAEDLRWSPPEQWHVTLAFLGEVEASEDRIVDVVAPAVAAAPPRIELRSAGPGRFGKRVLFLAIDDEPRGAVSELGSAIQRRLAAAGLPVDDKPVRPHLTLARSRGRGRAPVTRSTVESVPDIAVAWSVDETLLYASVSRGHGATNRYEVRRRVPLASG